MSVDMSANSSSNSSNSSFWPQPDDCFNFTTSTYIFTAFLLAYYLLLPLFIFVLYVGYRQWRQSVAMAAVMSHSDVFTFNMVALEMFNLLGFCFYCFGIYTNRLSVSSVGVYILVVTIPGETMFHLLSCVEHYLAVVHPVTYLGLRQAGGVRVRNISIGCVWLLCCSWLGLNTIYHFEFISNILFFVSSSVFVSFCSLRVLCVLIRPGPGDVGGNGERVDHSKLRAFHTIMAIAGALLLRFLSSLVYTVILLSPAYSYDVRCLVLSSAVWFSLPSSLVLPLLFLHRAGKLPGCKQDTEAV